RHKKEYAKKLEELEKQKKFDEQTVDFGSSKTKKIDGNYKFKPKNPFFWLYSGLIRSLAFIFAPIVNFFAFNVKIVGRKNLKKIKKCGAIAISNHVHSLDNLAIRQALFSRKIYLTGAGTNAKKGLMGITLKAGGFLPLEGTFSAQKTFAKVSTEILNKKKIILFYPERGMWVRYEKPRPFKKGAFYYAANNNVPILPIFITWKERVGIKKITRINKRMQVNILEPIFPKTDLDEKENLQYLKAISLQKFVDTYNEFYKKDMKIEELVEIDSNEKTETT
ncbi:MAG: lysophospholipid acyltransferase family protein, partial [Clostridia bacterium]